MLTCRVCDVRDEHARHAVLEMNFGTREEFPYFECSNCGTLQIVDIPHDLARHYPSNYLGEQSSIGETPANSPAERLRIFLKKHRAADVLHERNFVGWLIGKIRPNYSPDYFSWFRNARISLHSRILDVGCGDGRLLKSLNEQGFANAAGQDLFQKTFRPGVTVIRKPLDELEGEYDLIMLHHSFEHMPDPARALEELKRLCAPKGTILLRIPVAGCRAWKEYGTNWYQIDAPRHLVIPTEKGLRLLTKRAQLTLARVDFDSNETQFGCSEQYKMGVPLKDPNSYFLRRNTALFTEQQKREFRDRAQVANERGEGDQACFYLTR